MRELLREGAFEPSLASRMRPRALLNVTAICLLLAAATVWAPPPPPAAAPWQKPAPGQKPAAAKKAAAAQKAAVAQKPASTAQKPALPGSLSERAESRLKALEPTAALKQRAGLERLLKEVPDPQLKPLSKILLHKTGFLGFSIVDGGVKQFSTDFAAGAKNPDRFMSEVSLSQPALVEKWEKTPREKRIFVIGAGKDSAKVSEWAESMQSDGYSVFFYKFCRQSSGGLCSSKAVGAMCGTSGITMIYQTPSAELSEYVKVEAATAGFLEGLNDKVVLISTSEFLAASSRWYVANMPAPTPTPIK